MFAHVVNTSPINSLSDDEAIEASGLRVLVTYQAIVTFGHCLTLDIQERAQILEKSLLVAVVLRVILDVPLMGTQVSHQVVLLAQLNSNKLTPKLTSS